MEYPLITMSEEPEEATKTELALALAHGVSVASLGASKQCAQKHGLQVVERPRGPEEVLTCRRRILDRAVGRMARRATKAAEVIVEVAENAESESVRLRAARAVLSDMVTISRFADVEARMHEFEEKLRKDPTSFAPLPRR